MTFSPITTTLSKAAFVLACTFSLSAMSSCSDVLSGKISGNGTITTKTRSLGANITSVDAGVTGDVEVICTPTSSATSSIEITTDDNLHSVITTDVAGNALKIAFKGYVDGPTRLTIKVNTSMINTLIQSGTGSVSARGIDNAAMGVNLNGTGTMNVTGKTTKITSVLSGSGDINAQTLIAKEAQVTVSGTGNLRVFASDILDATLTSSGNILYYGNPAQIKRNITGSGSLRVGQ